MADGTANAARALQERLLKAAKVESDAGQFVQAEWRLLLAVRKCACGNAPGAKTPFHKLVSWQDELMNWVRSRQQDVLFPDMREEPHRIAPLVCNLKNCNTFVRRKERESNEISARCGCYQWFPRCDEELHMVALDRLSECLMARNKYINGFNVALAMVRTQPSHPLGYCRIAKTLRAFRYRTLGGPSAEYLASFSALSQEEQEKGFNSAVADLMCAYVDLGIKCMRTTEGLRTKDAQMFHVLHAIAHKLEMPVSRKDPAKALPRELMLMVLKELPTTSDLIRAQLVCRGWNDAARDPTVWATVELVCPRSGSARMNFTGETQLARWLRNRRGIRSFTIKDGKDFGLTTVKLYQIMALPRLANLSLRGRDDVSLSANVNHNAIRNCHLTSLTLTTVVHDSAPVLRQILQQVGPSLEKLCILGTPTTISLLLQSLSPMERLKELRLEAYHRRHRTDLYTPALVDVAPNLVQLWLDNFDLRCSQDPDWAGKWPNLRALVLGPGVGTHIFGNPSWSILPLSKAMRFISLDTPAAGLVSNILTGGFTPSANPSILEHPEGTEGVELWPNLEHLKIKSRLADIPTLQWVLGSSLRAGKLKSLGLHLGLSSPPANNNPLKYHGWHTQPVRDMPFLCADSLETVGLSEFNWSASTPGGDYFSTFESKPFLDWLDACPNARRVHVYPGHHANTGVLVRALVCRKPALSEIYLPRSIIIQGDRSYDGVEELAHQNGVALVWTDDRFMSSEWPVPL